MEVANVGCNYRHTKDFCVNRPNGSGDYILLLIKTQAYFVINNKTQYATPDSIIIFKKGTPQIYGASGGEYINDWIHFDLSDEEALRIENSTIPFDTVISINNSVEISGMIKSMFNEKYSLNPCKENSLNLYFELILLKIYESMKNTAQKKESRYYNELYALRNEIYQNPGYDWCIDNICRKMTLSRSYIQHIYKDFFGNTIMSDITNSRIELAKYLLSSTNFTVADISQQCGYNNDVHFMRIFKKTVGSTPTQFKNRVHIVQSEVNDAKSRNPFCLAKRR